MSNDKPRLRGLEAFVVEQDGERRVALRDPAGFTEHVAVLPVPLLDLVSLFDGEHSAVEMQTILKSRHGEAPSADQIGAIIERLDEAGFLESDRFRERRHAIEEAWRLSPVRPAAHAGGAYEGEPGALAAQIEGFFTHPEGPLAGRRAAEAPSSGLRGLIAPHIDFHRGGPTYAWAYRELSERSDADLF